MEINLKELKEFSMAGNVKTMIRTVRAVTK